MVSGHYVIGKLVHKNLDIFDVHRTLFRTVIVSYQERESSIQSSLLHALFVSAMYGAEVYRTKQHLNCANELQPSSHSILQAA